MAVNILKFPRSPIEVLPDIRNALTVDVEDYFQVSAFEDVVRRNDWSSKPSRVVSNSNKLLDLFLQHDAKATFFTLGWIAERHPEIVHRIASEGHELASHGYDHTRVTSMTEEQFREDISKTKQILEDLSGKKVLGYRAPTFSITDDNPWAYSVLRDTGHDYSSSMYPVKRDLYGNPDAPRFSYIDEQTGLLEIPLTTAVFAGKKIPCAGGGFFRFYPYHFTKWCYERVNRNENQATIFYTHPWEFDPDQPRPDRIGLKTRFRHYLNLSRATKRLDKLLRDFAWGRMDEIFLRDFANSSTKAVSA